MEGIKETNLPEKEKQQLEKTLARTVDAIQDPDTKPEDRAVYTTALTDVNEALAISQVPEISQPDRAAYEKIAGNVIVAFSPGGKPLAQKYAGFLGPLGDWLGTGRNVLCNFAPIPILCPNPPPKPPPPKPPPPPPVTPKPPKPPPPPPVTPKPPPPPVTPTPPTKPPTPPTTPTKPPTPPTTPTKPTTPPPTTPTTKPSPTGKGAQSPPKLVEKTTKALVVVQDSKSSEKELNDATRTLDELNESLKNSRYLEFLREVKRHNPPAACIEKIESATRVAGWPEGSLSGLADPSCSTAVVQGAQDTSSRWSALFGCVQTNPLQTSTCVVYIPKD
ncbi:hypothetical protein G5C60_18220 [Streptomyces sp. HC44]|uniref:Uncharacterized protein n=1 Tax=Streptomyces scabichelini TaxID=2711217 RepID=A0A6G4V5X5_9ACTN|nr:hypothetical protein [Streptomyces scabichelini]